MVTKRNAGYIFVLAAAFFAFAGVWQFIDARSLSMRVALGIGYGACSMLYIAGAVFYLNRSKQ